MKSLGAKMHQIDGLRRERMQASPLWVPHERAGPLPSAHPGARSAEGSPVPGGAFRNLAPIRPGLRDPAAKMPSLADFLCGGTRRVPTRPLPAADPRAGWLHAPASGLRATWLGHSTVLLEIDGARVLTDPVWGARASPSQLAGPKRFQPVPVALNALPPIDAVLVSHDHYDHLCHPTIRALAKTAVPFVTSLGVGAHLQAWGVPAERITELDWWESHRLPGTEVEITAAPSQHFSGRGLKDRNGTLWSSLAIRGPRHRVFFSGDTGLTDQYAEVRQRLGPFDLVMLEVGAFHPAWGDIHLGPDNALEAWQLLGGGAFLPVHWGTFSLAMHAWDAPAETLLARGPSLGAPLLMPMLGQPVEPAQVDGVTPWWRGVDTRGAEPPVAQTWPKTLPWPSD